jgi:hypothetical protein
VTARARARRLAAGAAGCLVVVGCASTTVDTVETTVPGPTAVTTTPSGSVDELLDRLLAEVTSLSELVVQNEGQREALARIEALWAVAETEVQQTRPDLAVDFAAAMELTRRSVERRRPADADKAANNLRLLIDSFPG